MPYTFYETIYSQYNTILTSASNTAANQILGAIGGYLTGALGLLVIVIGALMMVQRLHIGEGILWIVRAIAIANLLTVGNYSTYVMTPFLTTIPAAISSMTGLTNGSPANVAVTFDQLQSSVEKLTAVLDAAAGDWGFGLQIRIGLAYYAATWTLALGFFVAFVGMVFVAVVAPAGAVLMIFYLFKNTRPFAERWIGKMVALMVLQLFVSILMSMVMTEFTTVSIMEVSNSGTGDIAERISYLWDLALNFAIGVCLLIGLPIIAGHIGGGPVSALVQGPMRAATQAARTVASRI